MPTADMRHFSKEPTLREILRADSWVLLLGALLLSALAIRLNMLSGDTLGTFLQFPLSYADDGIAGLHTIRKLMDGWYLSTPRIGYPSGATFYDYPMADVGSLLVLKALAMLSGSPATAANLFFILGFPLAYASAHLTLRLHGLSRWAACACAILFAALPYHFLRLEHLFLTWYFQVPIYFHAGVLAFWAGKDDKPLAFLARHWRLGLLLAVLSSFGLYYAFFGALLICVCGLAGWLRNRSFTALAGAGAASALISAGLALSIAPHYAMTPYQGSNPDAVIRWAYESEVYGLKLTQLLTPQIHHRSPKLRRIAERYHRDFPLANENHTASLGLIGGIGVLIILWQSLALMAGADRPHRIQQPLVVAFMALLLFATIGGLSTVFSSTLSPVIRGTNRASVFLGFLALAAFFFSTQSWFERTGKPGIAARRVALGLLLLLGLWDQSPKLDRARIQAQRDAFLQDEKFIHAIEASLTPGAAIFQLPYMVYPEGPMVHRLATYGLTIGYTHSTHLRWSYGAMRGRPEDAYARATSTLPAGELIGKLKADGFSGLYIDRRGYADGGAELERALQQAGAPLSRIVHPSGQIAFYRLVQ